MAPQGSLSDARDAVMPDAARPALSGDRLCHAAADAAPLLHHWRRGHTRRCRRDHEWATSK